ncbi:hypothetical protein ABPG72_017623 [Tetrahymena utriculariae]
MIKLLLIISLSVSLVFAAQGLDAVCNDNTHSVASCGPAGGNTWEAGTAGTQAKITDCAQALNMAGIYDTFCASCQADNPYANQEQNNCVNAISRQGQVAACASNTDQCINCNSPSPAFTWTNVNENNCRVTSCLSAPFPTSNLNDDFCTSCGGANRYTNIAGTACVNSSDSCSRITVWTNEDCLACRGADNQYASEDQSQCIAAPPVIVAGVEAPCASNTNQCTNCNSPSAAFTWTNVNETNCRVTSCSIAAFPTSNLNDNFCTSCGGVNRYTNIAGTACVNSSDSCSRITVWTNEDCLACRGAGNQYASEDQSQCIAAAPVIVVGVEAPCASNTNQCTNCNSPSAAFTWTNVNENNCRVTSCSIAAFPTSNLNDNFCTSCGGANRYTNIAGTACVNSSDSCSRITVWTNEDCLACRGADNQYASEDQSQCITVPPVIVAGVEAPCASNTNQCTNCNSPSAAFTWTNVNETNCRVTSCSITAFPTSNLNDNFCTSCGGANKYANSDSTACVNPTDGNCSRKSNWTDADCKICNENGINELNVYASQDKKSCTTTQSSSSSSSSQPQPQPQPSQQPSSSIIIALSGLIAGSLLF